MKTPICDFVKNYSEKAVIRAHMPGHKGKDILGFETLDITEIRGADSLWEANGIIEESEKNAGKLFGANTFFSTEGSSLCIKGMLYLCLQYAKRNGKEPIIWAGRNAHKSFLSAIALLDMDVIWLTPKIRKSYLSCRISAEELDEELARAETLPVAVYITSPDYLGNISDIEGLSKVCHKYGVLLTVDNAHGAYLKFLPTSLHPIDFGADMCCDSAHKTLPALTGGAYLHISKEMPLETAGEAKRAMALFGSTSPSYLVLQSLDAVNAYIDGGYAEKLREFTVALDECKKMLVDGGYILLGDEPLKLTVAAREYGYSGDELAEFLAKKGIVCEFSDGEFTVMMLTPENGREDVERIVAAMLSVPKRAPIDTIRQECVKVRRAMSVRQAMFSVGEFVSIELCEGRVLAQPTVACPPAVPILVSGELIDKQAIKMLEYYGIKECFVVKK